MKKFAAILLAALLAVSLCVNVSAVDFVKSRKWDEPIKVPVDGEESLLLVITPVACKKRAMVPEIEAMLDGAEQQVIAADSVATLTGDIGRALEVVKAASDDPAVKELTVNDLLVLDLFDVSLVRNGTTFERVPAGQAISFSVQTDLTQDDLFFVLHNYSGASWEVVDLCELHDNGVLDIILFGLSPLAIIVGSTGKQTAPPGESPVSPQTGEPSYTALYLGSACIAAAVAAAGCLLRRRQDAA